VVEWGKGALQIVRSDTWYQIATNFVMDIAEELEKGRQRIELATLFDR
jgi:hypothetical protein